MFVLWFKKMDERSRNEVSPQLLDLIPNEREWHMKKGEGGKSSEERKLELRLGPPGVEDWSLNDKMKNTQTDHESLLSLGYYSPMMPHSAKLSSNNGFHSYQHHHQGSKATSFLHHTSSQTCGPKVVELQQNKGSDNNNKVFSSPSSANTAVPNSSQKRYSSFSIYVL